MCVCMCVCVIQGFDKSISATAFINSCQHLQFNLSIMHENIQIQKTITATKRQDTTKNRKQNINPFNHQIYKMVKYTQTTRLLLLTNCLNVFDRFVGLALKGLKSINFFIDIS